MKYGKLTMGQMEAIINKLGGEEGARRLLSGELMVSVPRFTKMTVKLGTHKTPDSYRRALKKKGVDINRWADEILSKITCSQEEIDLDLVAISVRDLMDREGDARCVDISAKAQELNLELCPAEVGPALALKYTDRGWFCVAMDPVADCYGGCKSSAFNVGNFELEGYFGDFPDGKISDHCRLVFRRK